jgi:LysR family transcriptional regulator for metE and metH
MQSLQGLRHLNRLTVKQLQALVALDQSGGPTRAARNLAISQPALSNRLREVERLTGAKIFDRSSHRLHFTSIGRILLNAAVVVLDELTQAEFYISQSAQRSRETVRVEIRGYNLYPALCPLLAELMANPDFPIVEMTLDPSRLPLEALISGDVDLTIALGSFKRRDLLLHALYADELVGILPLDHPLVSREYLSPADFVNETYITFDTVLERGQEVERFFLPAGVVPKQLVSVGTSDYVCGLVASGTGVSILSRWAVENHQDRGRLSVKPLNRNGVKVSWYAVSRHSDSNRQSTAEILQRLPEIFR